MSDVARGSGIFGTDIDLSALDVDTAYRLGLLFGEQMKAAHAGGVRVGRTQAAAEIRSKAAEADSHVFLLAMEIAARIAAGEDSTDG